jgi:hypothetical protein
MKNLIKLSTVTLVFLISLSLANNVFADYSWTETNSPSKTWKAIVVPSTDSSKAFAITNDVDFIYTSTDSGLTWNPIASSTKWTGIAVSADGQSVVATTQTTYESRGWMYRSSDSGLTWIELTFANQVQWTDVKISDDGQKIIGVGWQGDIVTSNDGSVWSTDNSHSGSNWTTIAGSGDFSKLAIAANNGSISTNINNTGWDSHSDSSGTGCWSYMSATNNGSKLFAGDCDNDAIKISTDDGVTWTPTTSGNGTWYAVSASSDGSVLAGADHAGKIVVSTDGGTTWTEQTTAGNHPWSYVSVFPDGQNILASYDGGKIMKGTFFTPPPPPDNATSTPVDTSTSTPSDTPTSTPPVTTTIINTSSGGSSSSGSRIAFPFATTTIPAFTSPTNSCITINTSLRLGSTGSEVTKLQEFLNKFIDAGLAISGNYDASTASAVKVFQTKYANDILAPWGVTEPSGIVSFTTIKKLNELSCSQEFPLSSVEQYLIDQYKSNPGTVSPESTTTPVEVGTNTIKPPEENITQTAGIANTEVSGNIFKKIVNFFKTIF